MIPDTNPPTNAGRRLARALGDSAAAAGCAVRVVAASERTWDSATFVGTRHLMRLEGSPGAALSSPAA